MTEHDQDQPGEGISRRQVLRRAAVVGAVAWATPVVQSIHPARAYAGTPRDQVCYSVKISPDGNCFAEQNSAGYHCISPEVGEAGGCGFVSATAVSPDPDSGTMTVTIAAGCTLVDAKAKCGDAGCQSPMRTSNPQVWVFTPCQGSGPNGNNQGISGLEIVVCCQAVAATSGEEEAEEEADEVDHEEHREVEEEEEVVEEVEPDEAPVDEVTREEGAGGEEVPDEVEEGATTDDPRSPGQGGGHGQVGGRADG